MELSSASSKSCLLVSWMMSSWNMTDPTWQVSKLCHDRSLPKILQSCGRWRSAIVTSCSSYKKFMQAYFDVPRIVSKPKLRCVFDSTQVTQATSIITQYCSDYMFTWWMIIKSASGSVSFVPLHEHPIQGKLNLVTPSIETDLCSTRGTLIYIRMHSPSKIHVTDQSPAS